VNLLIRQRGRFAAPEFLPLGTAEPWRPAQSLLWAKTMGLYLSNNWRTEIERSDLAARLPPDRLWELWPLDASPGRPDVLALDGPRPPPVRAAEVHALPGVRGAAAPASGLRRGCAPALQRLQCVGPFPAASVARRSWRAIRISPTAPPSSGISPASSCRATLRGATSPGVPFVVIGRSHDLAWGFTTTHSDTQDVFIEDEAAVTASREEVIRVRGAPDHRLRIRETRNGPVISDLDPGQGRMLAVRMANLEPNDSAATGLLALNRAASLAEARAAAALIASPPQNLMLADRHGGIAMFLTGRVPIRAEGHDGALPARAAPWQGFVPFDALPHAGNPASGRLVNANNRIQPPPEPGTSAEPYLGRDWFGDWRFRRIHERLDAAPASLDGSPRSRWMPSPSWRGRPCPYWPPCRAAAAPWRPPRPCSPTGMAASAPMRRSP
jgi:penicillin amidase